MIISKLLIGPYLYFLRTEIDDIADLERRLTVRPTFSEDNRDAIEMFDNRSATWFGIPWFCKEFPESQRFHPKLETKDYRVRPKAQFTAKTKLFPEQQDVLDIFRKRVNAGKNGFILEAKPGFGKTVTAIHMMAMLGYRTLVVVPRSNLIKQWMQRLEQHSTLRSRDIGWIEGSKGDWKNKSVVVGLVHSLALDRMGRDFRKAFGTIVFDEVDRSVPPSTFAPVVSMFLATYRIGLSATLRRQDGMHVVFENHLGQVFLKGQDTNRMVPKICMAYFEEFSGWIPDYLQKMQRRGVLISNLAGNMSRNRLIAEYTKSIFRSGRKCVVLSDRKIQLKKIYQFLLELGVSEKEIGFYVRGFNGKNLTELDRRRVANDCNIILATYAMMAIGTDIPDLAGLVYATPQSEVEQSKGRIERFVSGKKQPVVIDIVDTAYNETLGWAKKRIRHYQRNNLFIKSISMRGRQT